MAYRALPQSFFGNPLWCLAKYDLDFVHDVLRMALLNIRSKEAAVYGAFGVWHEAVRG